MNLTRILGCVGVFTLAVLACNDKDVSLIQPDAGVGGSSGNAGSGGSSGNGGSGGSSGNAGSGGLGGSAGNANAGSGGVSGSAGSPGTDPDAGDSGTPPGPYAAICESYCGARAAWATATSDAGVNCPGYDSSGCQAACETELAGYVTDLACPAAPAAYECHATANAWYCLEGVVYANNCESNFGFDGTNFTCGTNCDSTCNTQAGAFNTCTIGAPVCS